MNCNSIVWIVAEANSLILSKEMNILLGGLCSFGETWSIVGRKWLELSQPISY